MSIEIDGRLGEGGGQILRTALGFSSLFGKDITVKNIRSGRSSPGLKPQHLVTLKALQGITNAEVEGDFLHSDSILFRPGELNPGNYLFNIGTAGSVTLLLHALLLPLSCANGTSIVTVTGGTDVPWSPTVDYFKNVTLRSLNDIGLQTELTVYRRGYYPKGGGKVSLKVCPWENRLPLKGTIIGKPEKLYIFSSSSGLPRNVTIRQAESARKALGNIDTDIIYDLKGNGTGSSITICGMAGQIPIGYSVIGKRGLRAEDVGLEAAQGISEIIRGGNSDPYLPDQLAPFLSVIDGTSEISIPHMTGHLKTNIEIIKRFIDVEWSFRKNIWKIKGKNKDINRS